LFVCFKLADLFPGELAEEEAAGGESGLEDEEEGETTGEAFELKPPAEEEVVPTVCVGVERQGADVETLKAGDVEEEEAEDAEEEEEGAAEVDCLESVEVEVGAESVPVSACWNSTISTETLSWEWSCFTACAPIAAAASVQVEPFLSSRLINRQASAFCITSNRPSQASSRYLSSVEILCSLISGSGITKSRPSDLKSQSPIALETAKPPITRL